MSGADADGEPNVYEGTWFEDKIHGLQFIGTGTLEYRNGRKHGRGT